MLALRPPWAEITSIHQLWAAVRRGERPGVTAAHEANAPEGYIALMRELWAQDPVARPTFAEALQRLRAIAKAVAENEPMADRADLDLVSDLFQQEFQEGRDQETGGGDTAVDVTALQQLGSTPTVGDYARTLGHASIVDFYMASQNENEEVEDGE